MTQHQPPPEYAVGHTCSQNLNPCGPAPRLTYYECKESLHQPGFPLGGWVGNLKGLACCLCISAFYRLRCVDASVQVAGTDVGWVHVSHQSVV